MYKTEIKAEATIKSYFQIFFKALNRIHKAICFSEKTLT